MTFPWVVFLIMKSKIYSYIEKGDILLKIRPHCWCTATLCFTLHFELKLLKRWVVSLTDELLLIIMSSTFYSILKLTLTHYLVSLWMQRFTQFWGRRGGGGFSTRLFWRCGHGYETYESDRRNSRCLLYIKHKCMFLPLPGGISGKFFNSIIKSMGRSILIYKSKVYYQ